MQDSLENRVHWGIGFLRTLKHLYQNQNKNEIELDFECVRLLTDLLKECEEKIHKENEQKCQCSTCKYYEGVHDAQGHAPCSFWNIGGVMWNDYCSRHEKNNK